jgi:hypothetical protein
MSEAPISQQETHEPIVAQKENLRVPFKRDKTWLEQVTKRVNDDVEMALIGRHFNVSISFTFGDERHDLVIDEGKVVDLRHGEKIDHRVDFGFRASNETWDKFFQNPPPPLYNSIFAMIMRISDFHVDGDSLVFAQNVRAVSRLLDIMQTEGQHQ